MSVFTGLSIIEKIKTWFKLSAVLWVATLQGFTTLTGIKTRTAILLMLTPWIIIFTLTIIGILMMI